MNALHVMMCTAAILILVYIMNSLYFKRQVSNEHVVVDDFQDISNTSQNKIQHETHTVKQPDGLKVVVGGGWTNTERPASEPVSVSGTLFIT